MTFKDNTYVNIVCICVRLPHAYSFFYSCCLSDSTTLRRALKPQVLQAECNILKTIGGGKLYCLELIGLYETPKVIYIVTELCSGGEMTQYVSQRDELRTEDVSRIAYQLLSAVNHCASNGVIHRDIKAENVMFCSSDSQAELRLIDLGGGAST
jgi:calcium-dependent protein kinase